MPSFSTASLTALQVYGIAIVISILVAILIKALVLLTGRLEQASRTKATIATQLANTAADAQQHQGVPDEVVAAITSAIAAVTKSSRIIHISESNRSWVLEGRSALHSHQPKR